MGTMKQNNHVSSIDGHDETNNRMTLFNEHDKVIVFVNLWACQNKTHDLNEQSRDVT